MNNIIVFRLYRLVFLGLINISVGLFFLVWPEPIIDMFRGNFKIQSYHIFILVFMILIISYKMVRGLAMILPCVFAPHLKIAEKSIYIRPVNRFKTYRIDWEQIDSVDRIMSGRIGNAFLFYEKFKNKEGFPAFYQLNCLDKRQYRIAACGLSRKAQYSLEKILESHISLDYK